MAAGEGSAPAWFRPVLAPKRCRWEWWIGVNGMFYARWHPSSPPKVVRATGLAEMLAAMDAAVPGWAG